MKNVKLEPKVKKKKKIFNKQPSGEIRTMKMIKTDIEQLEAKLN